ncbi:TlpA disulfide reductase family protein [Xanthocytophaga agilis]|uniref:TlpA disulfide reductase family protein n=1 Tax=Xanthocytophaga agilis TaxID=3048010 RepID=A0AAE3UIP8_9BACT|nr:TlpA disulfide reductase family protein [Xanthocytophaga agilis]MDJ1504707.1 TlpA disulfide reductase family protein [Xanthocytophaga agilis]
MRILTILFILNISTLCVAKEIVLKGQFLKGRVPDKVAITLFYGTISGKGDFDVLVKNGRFELKGVLSHPCLALVKATGASQEFGIWLDDGTIDATFEIYNHPSMNRPYLATISSTGTVDTEFYTQLYNHLKVLSQKDKLTGATIYKELQKDIEPHIEKYPSSYLSLMLVKDFMDERSLGEAWGKKYMSYLDQSLFNSEPGKDLLRKIKRDATNQVGFKMADFELPDTTGKPVSLKDIHSTYTLLDFWSSWCGPCRAENKLLTTIYTKYKSKGLEIVSISMDQTKTPWINAIHKDGLTWLQLCDFNAWNGVVAKQVNLTSIPYNILLDKDKKIVGVDLKDGELEKLLDKLLSN